MTTSFPPWTAQRWAAVRVEQAALLRAALAGADPALPVPCCPGWTMADLARHTGRFLRTATGYLVSGTRVARRPEPPAPEQDPLGYFDRWLGSATEALAVVAPNRPVWTFARTAPDLAWVWHRRVAHELNLRRHDAQSALGTPAPTEPAQAVDAVDELLGTLLPAGWHPDGAPRLTGRVLVSSAEGAQWTVVFEPGTAPAVTAGPGPAEVTLRGTANDLLHQLCGRQPFTVEHPLLAGLRMA